MAKLENLRKANERSELWPTISDAVDTYLRRHATGADPYERIWRLIHVWESTAITLAAAAISRIRTTPNLEAVWLRCREYCHGRQFDQVTQQITKSQGALSGSIDYWINVLFEVAKVESAAGFVEALKNLLNAEQIHLGSLVEAWSLACDVPTDARREAVTVKQALRHVNAFRNRLAHVPFPHDPLAKIAEGLEQVTEELFSVEPLPWKVFLEGQANSPLVGGFLSKGFVLRANQIIPSEVGSSAQSEVMKFVHPGRKPKGEVPWESWGSSPFVHVDQMMRPHILTRLKDEAVGTWEYTRFRAEANALITEDDLDRLSDLPLPKPQDYPQDKEAVAHEQTIEASADAKELRPAETFDEAINAMRAEDYDAAIPFFEKLSRDRPKYHIAWLRLGLALREKGVRVAEQDKEPGAELLKKSIQALTEAAGHVDPEYQGQALYERSKAHFQMVRFGLSVDGDRAAARNDAEEACRLSPEDPRFATWLEYLERRGFSKENAAE